METCVVETKSKRRNRTYPRAQKPDLRAFLVLAITEDVPTDDVFALDLVRQYAERVVSFFKETTFPTGARKGGETLAIELGKFRLRMILGHEADHSRIMELSVAFSAAGATMKQINDLINVATKTINKEQPRR